MNDQLLIFEGQTQAAGAFVVDLSAVRSWEFHQVQVGIIDGETPSAGTLYIDGRTPGAAEYQNMGNIDMTGTDLVAAFSGVCLESMRIRPALLDADKSFNVVIYSMEN